LWLFAVTAVRRSILVGSVAVNVTVEAMEAYGGSNSMAALILTFGRFMTRVKTQVLDG